MIRIGAVGLGAWGWNVARNFSALKGCQLVACADLSARRREQAMRAWPGVQTFESLDDILRLDIVDAVVIAAPAVEHYPLARKALLAGKDVFVEKPFTLNVANATELVELASIGGRTLMVGHLLEYHPVVNKLKQLIQSGELGPMFYIYSQRVNLGRIRGDENALWSFAPHDISQILYMLDMEPENVSARGQSYVQDGIEDVVFLSLFFPNRVMAHIHLSWLDPHKERKTTVVGANKMAVFDDSSTTEKLRIYDNHAEMPATQTYGEAIQVRFGDILIPHLDAVEPLRIECEHFVDCVTNRATPRSDGRDGLRVVRILEAAQKSLDQDGVPVNINGQLSKLNGDSRRWVAARV